MNFDELETGLIKQAVEFAGENWEMFLEHIGEADGADIETVMESITEQLLEA